MSRGKWEKENGNGKGDWEKVDGGAVKRRDKHGQEPVRPDETEPLADTNRPDRKGSRDQTEKSGKLI